ncbi:MAG: hypothetical protein KDK48_04095 [Chlamydiia bacterium]|nr:hypothetical protein [Chlamydiia bacterium]
MAGTVNSPLVTFLTNNWQRKLLAITLALIFWYFINQSIIETKTLIGVPIRIINLPPNKTIEGLLPNGLLSRRVTLTISGSKKVIENISADDLEIKLDAMNAPRDWLVQVTKRNLVSLNPSVNLVDAIDRVTHREFVITLHRLVTAEIPIEIETPTGTLPRSYLFLGLWPQNLTQTVVGPEEQIDKLKIEGLELNFNLNDISKAELNALTSPQRGRYSDDVVYFKVPDSWKRVFIPFMTHPWQPINDPNADDLWIEFLRKKFIPLKKPLPIRVFYPTESLGQINPNSFSLSSGGVVTERNGAYLLNMPLYAYEVSQLFLDIVRDNMEIAIIADGKSGSNVLKWSVEFVEPQVLEERYVEFLSEQYKANSPDQKAPTKEQITAWENRFRSFMLNLTLYRGQGRKLDLRSRMDEGKIKVELAE